MGFAGNGNLEMSNITYGVSAQGMQKYREEVRAKVLEESVKLLNATEPVVKGINDCWQGVSAQRFLQMLEKATVDIGEDFVKEYLDLDARITELQNNLFKADVNMNQ